MTSLLLPFRVAGLPFRAVEKPYVAGVERVVYYLWDRIDSKSSSQNSQKDDEIMTDLSHHLQSVGVDEVVRWMTLSEKDVLFRRQPHQQYEKYPLLRFATWMAYDNLPEIPLHYEDTSRQHIPLFEVATTRILSPTVLEVECRIHGGGIGGPDFVKRQLASYCNLLNHQEEKELFEEVESKPVMQFVLPNDALSIATQTTLLEERHAELEQQIETYFQNTKMVLDHAQALVRILPPDQLAKIAKDHHAAMQQELYFREKMAALMGDPSSTAMVEKFQQIIIQEELSSMSELEKVERGLEKIERGRKEGLEQLQRIVRKVKQKVTGVPMTVSMPCMSNEKQAKKDDDDDDEQQCESTQSII